MIWNDIKRIPSTEGNVDKFVYTKENAIAESVLYKYPTYEERTVICCSSQSGCPVGCRFCGAGDYFVRSLTSEEIVSQAVYSVEQTKVSNPLFIKRLQIMFMSMGEPLLNKQGMVPALHTLHGMYPNAALLISSIGPRIDYDWVYKVSKEIRTIGLQFSIHKSTDEARNDLIPFKKKLSLKEIAVKGGEWYHYMGDGRKPFFNYCAGDDNTSIEDADRLAKQFSPNTWNATISVICERNEGMPAKNAHQVELAANFASKLVERGYNTRVFDPAGQDDIGGGCGQLWFVQDWMQKNPDKAIPSIGNGKPIVHVPQEV